MTEAMADLLGNVLTLIAAAIAAGAAIYVAEVSYPKQKRQDRNLKIDEEKRLVFREFLRSLDHFINTNALAEREANSAEILLRTKASLNEVWLFADGATTQAMDDLFQKAVALKAAADKVPYHERDQRQDEYKPERAAYEASFQAALNAARAELEHGAIQLGIGAILLNKRFPDDPPETTPLVQKKSAARAKKAPPEAKESET